MKSFWSKDPSVLLNDLASFYPTSIQSRAEKLNSLVRLSFYISIILSIYHSNPKFMYILIFILLITLLIYTETNTTENFTESCTRPSIANPLMNFTMGEFLNTTSEGDIIDRNPSCSNSIPKIKQEIDESFNNNLYKDVGDLFGKNNSQRQFYTMPNTNLVNDRDSFSNWLYGNKDDTTCKDQWNSNGTNCSRLNYEPLQSNRMDFPEYIHTKESGKIKLM